MQPQSEHLWRTLVRIRRGGMVRAQLWPFLLVILGGCGNDTSAPATLAPRFAGTEVRISCPAGTAKKLLERYAHAWARLNKVKLHFDDQHADLVVFTPADMGRLAESGQIAPLFVDAKPAGDEWNGFTQLYRNKLLLWGGTPYAFPLLGDATFVIYRADLLRTADTHPPASFAEFTAVAQKLADLRQRPVLPPLPADDDGLDRLFHSAAAVFVVDPVSENKLAQRTGGNDTSTASLFSFHRDVATGKPRLTHPGFVAALDWMKSLQPLRAKTGTVAATLSSDDAIMALGSLDDLAALVPVEHPGRYAVAPIPNGPHGERVPYIGPRGALIARTQSAKNPAAALALAQYLSSPETSTEAIHDPVFGCAPYRTAHLLDHRDGWYNYGLDVPATMKLLEALQVVAEPRIVNAPLRYRMPDEAEYRRVLLDGVRKCVTENGDAAATLAAIDSRWREMDAAHPMDRKTMYLRSLNLAR